jgi:hypothetical protein
LFHSLFERVVREKGLHDYTIKFQINQEHHSMEIIELLDIVEQKRGLEKKFIENTVNDLILMNGDFKDFIEFLAKSYYMEDRL